MIQGTHLLPSPVQAPVACNKLFRCGGAARGAPACTLTCSHTQQPHTQGNPHTCLHLSSFASFFLDAAHLQLSLYLSDRPPPLRSYPWWIWAFLTFMFVLLAVGATTFIGRYAPRITYQPKWPKWLGARHMLWDNVPGRQAWRLTKLVAAVTARPPCVDRCNQSLFSALLAALLPSSTEGGCRRQGALLQGLPLALDARSDSLWCHQTRVLDPLPLPLLPGNSWLRGMLVGLSAALLVLLMNTGDLLRFVCGHCLHRTAQARGTAHAS